MADANPSGPGRKAQTEKKSAKTEGIFRNAAGQLVKRKQMGTKEHPIIAEVIVFEDDYIDDLEQE